MNDTVDDVLLSLADALGLCVTVVRDPRDGAAALRATWAGPQAVDCEIADELLAAETHAAACARLLAREIYRAQARLFDKIAAYMTEHDDRGRQYTLSIADKETLHEMYTIALEAVLSDISKPREADEKHRRFEGLMQRLFK